MLPLLAVAGGLGAALALLGPVRRVPSAAIALPAGTPVSHRAFRSRAPPR
jgi:hypothetical protein